MKKHSALLMFILSANSSLYSMQSSLDTNIDSILKIKPDINYYENLKYQEIKKYQKLKEKEIKSTYDFGFNIDINKEERTLDGIKIDIGTNF